jgi:hypothetical protein
MLFDLRSPGRRRFIKVIYGGLALLMGGGLIFFGIGSDAQGGLSELFGNNDGADEALENQLEDAEKKLETTPNDPQALLELANARMALSGAAGDLDEETGFSIPNSDSGDEATKAIDAWEQYLATKPKNPDAATASKMAPAYLLEKGIVLAPDGSGQLAVAFGEPTLPDVISATKRSAEAQAIVAEARPDQNSLGTLALYQYYSGDFAAAGETGDRALATAEGTEKETLQQALKTYEELGNRLQEALAKAEKQAKKQGDTGAAGGGSLEDLNSLGGGSGLSTP